MKNLWKAHDEISRLSKALATVIGDHSRSFDDANALFMHAFQTTQLYVQLKVTSPHFKQRAEQERLAKARQEKADGDIKLMAQLGEFGIDHRPIFADRLSDGD